MNEFSYEVPDVKATEKFYKRSQWWISHRARLKHVGFGVWIALDVFLVSFTLWVFVDTFLIHYETERGLLRSLLIENPTTLYATSRVQAATPLTIDGTPTVLASGDGAWDVVGFMTNPNEDWWAEAVYQFTYGADTATSPNTAVLYPKTTQPLLALGIKNGQPTNANLRLLGLRWHRIDPHTIPDFSAWKTERLNLVVADAAFSGVLGGEKTLGRSTFSVANQSAFGYWSVPLAILLKRGSAIVGVSTTSLEQLEAGETRRVSLTWFESIPGVGEIEVVPLLNLFDASNYLPARSERSRDTRTDFGQ